MNQISASKSFTVTTVQDGRDTADVVVRDPIISYLAIDGKCVKATTLGTQVVYTGPDSTQYFVITRIVSQSCPSGMSLSISGNGEIEVNIPLGCESEGAVTVVAEMQNGDHTKTAENIRFTLNVLQKSDFVTYSRNVLYKSLSSGVSVANKEWNFANQFWSPVSITQLYGENVFSFSLSRPNVSFPKGANPGDKLILELFWRHGDSYHYDYLQYNFVQDLVNVTNNPNFENEDQTLADDCSDTICIDAYGPGDSQEITRWLYLPNEASWQYRRITIYRWATITGLRPVGSQYTIHIGSQNGNNIKDVRKRLHQIVETPGYTIGISHKVVLWSDGNNWVLLEDNEMDADNIVTVE